MKNYTPLVCFENVNELTQMELLLEKNEIDFIVRSKLQLESNDNLSSSLCLEVVENQVNDAAELLKSVALRNQLQSTQEHDTSNEMSFLIKHADTALLFTIGIALFSVLLLAYLSFIGVR